MSDRVLTKNFILGKTRLDNVANVKNLNFWGQELQDVSVIEEMPNVIAYLDGLTKLDDDDISPEEREMAKQFRGLEFATDAPRRSPSPKVKSKSPPKAAIKEDDEQAMITKPRHKLARTPPRKDVPKIYDPVTVTESSNFVSNRRLHNDNTPIGGGNIATKNESPVPVANPGVVSSQQQPSKSIPSPQPSPVESDYVVHAKQDLQKNLPQPQEECEEEEEPPVVVKRDGNRQQHDPYLRMQREGNGNGSPPPQQDTNRRHTQQQHISVQQSYQGLPQHYQQQHYMEQLPSAHRQHSGRDMTGYNQNYQQNVDYGTHQRAYDDNYLDNQIGHNNYSHHMNSRVSTAQQGQRSRWEASQVSNIPYFPSSENYPQQPSRARYNQQQGYQKSQPPQLPPVNRNTLLNVVLDLVNELDPERLILVRQEIDKILMN
nr:unnamed protein product [Naegleria fowleri]